MQTSVLTNRFINVFGGAALLSVAAIMTIGQSDVSDYRLKSFSALDQADIDMIANVKAEMQAARESGRLSTSQVTK